MQEVNIELNKSKLVGLFIACLGFVAGGFWMVLSPETYENTLVNNKTILAVLGIFSALLFSVMAYFIGKKIPDQSPGMVISSKGVLDNSSSNAAGFIAWEDIADIKSKMIGTQKFILIMVNDPQKFIENENRALLKRAFKYNHKKYGTPIAISAVTLTMTTNQVIELLKDYLTNFENQANSQE